jgi:BON domain
VKRTLPSLTVIVLAATMGLGIGCARKRDDATISSNIQSKFSQDSGLSSKQLAVQSSNGVVTLSGSVDNDAQRDAAARQAASVAGVKQVVNNLQVGGQVPAPPTTQKAEAAPAPSVKAEKPAPGKKSRHSHRTDEATNDHADDNGAMTAQNSEPPVAQVPPPPDATPAPAAVPSTPPPPPPPPQPKPVTIEQGTQLTVRLVDGIDSEKNEAGQTFHATLNAPLTVNGDQVIAAGSDVTGHIADLRSAGKFKGQSLVVLQLDSISAGGQSYNIQTDQYRKEGSSRSTNTAEKVGAGAVVGAVLGGLLGGGKGAGIGAAAGAGAGGGAQAASKSQQIKLPPETVLNFTLQAPVTVTKAPNPDANRPKLSDSH